MSKSFEEAIMDFESVEEMLDNPSPIYVVEIGGLGPDYEDACLTVFLRTLKYFEENDLSTDDIVRGKKLDPEIRKELTKKMEDIAPSGAMFNGAVHHALHVKRSGYKSWILSVDRDRVKMWKPHLDWEDN